MSNSYAAISEEWQGKTRSKPYGPGETIRNHGHAFVSICSNAENRLILDMYTQFSYEELDGVIFSSTTADNGSSTSHYPSRVGSLLILAYKFEQQISMTVDGFF